MGAQEAKIYIWREGLENIRTGALEGNTLGRMFHDTRLEFPFCRVDPNIMHNV